MSLLKISAIPAKVRSACLACDWFESLSDEEQTYFAELVKNYSISGLHRELANINVKFSEATLRNHIVSGH